MRFSQVIALTYVIIRDPRVVIPVLRWPGFSLTSYKLMQSLNRTGLQPRAVIDVGANVGQFAVATMMFYPDVSLIMFEPNPEAVGKLRQAVSRFPSARIKDCALGAIAEEAELHVNSKSQSSSLLKLSDRHKQAFPAARELANVKVRVATLDAELRDVELPRPCLLKLDVQGSEASVLAGAKETLQRVDYIITEMSFRPLYQGETLLPDLLMKLRNEGFELDRALGSLADPKTGELLQFDALFRRAGH